MRLIVKDRLGSLMAILPKGTSLPAEAWARRHRAILVVLWAHVLALAIIGLATGNGWTHSLMEAAIIAIFATGATLKVIDAPLRAVLATLGLVASSAILVHFSDGLIEMHFHFFVMVAVVTLYQAWLPFLTAIGFVLLHHGIVGAIDPSAVYNHPEAITAPWRWAVVHAIFIAGESAAGLAAWKLNELGSERERKARSALESAITQLGEAQAMSHIGNWDWDLVSGRLWWSAELFRVFGVHPKLFVPTYEAYLDMVHPDDRDRHVDAVELCYSEGKGFDQEIRIVQPDGTVRTIHALGVATRSDDGTIVKLSGTGQDVTERRSLEEKVEHQAFHDSLTDLANRALFLDRVEHALTRQQRVGSPLAVLFLDLDDFKTVNDSMGHRAGDELLVDVAQRIHLSLRPADTVARLGGDEFSILLEDITGVEDAVMVAQRLREMLSEPFLVDGTELFIHASIGIAFSTGDGTTSPGDLLRDADSAMYEAKRAGKGSHEVFQTKMRLAATERLQLRADLQRAVENQEFILHYQPIVRPGTGEIVGAEALLRWNHPERGIVPPLDFIPFAEESGLIVPIGRWVLEEACRTAADWTTDSVSGAPLTISVNISAIRFRHAGLVEELVEVLEATGLPAERLILELTESVLVQDSELVVGRLTELKELGVQLAIDDFGTGYSSLSYLRDFPIDVLKIDKTFIDSVALGTEDSALARAVIRLGQTLGLKVVAEGVEEPEQAETLRSLGCPLVQGFLFSRPVEDHFLVAMLAAGAVHVPSAESHVRQVVA